MTQTEIAPGTLVDRIREEVRHAMSISTDQLREETGAAYQEIRAALLADRPLGEVLEALGFFYTLWKEEEYRLVQPWEQETTVS